MSVGLTKRQIRSNILFRLREQKEDNRDKKSKTIQRELFRTKEFKKAKVLMFYVSFGGEVKTAGMIKSAKKQGKIVALPVCQKNRGFLRPILLEDNVVFKKGPYGIPEPAAKKTVPLDTLDLVIVPGVAFDKKGNRLGRGKGYYDRFLKRIPEDTETIGLAFDFQILPSLPTTKDDVSVKKVLFA